MQPADIVERLRISSEPVTTIVFDAIVRMNTAEDQREVRLDAKAQGLLATVGVATTLALAFGGLLVKDVPNLNWSKNLIAASLVAYLGTLLCGLVAGGFALLALLVREDYRNVSAEDLLSREELDAADDPDGDGAQRYRRFLAAHLLQIALRHSLVHERKAKIIKKGQWAFFLFLVGVLAIGVTISMALVVR